jgi:7-cyano-7-deazaguanine synthase in queuosine biosynthesis
MNPMQPPINSIFCGELCTNESSNGKKIINLSYYDNGIIKPNVDIKLSKFVNDINSLPDRIVDLLEIASYVYAADRSVFRGKRDSVDNESWSRSFEFHIPVRDFDFWDNEKIKTLLSSALIFMTGDRQFNFVFEKYKNLPALSIQALLFTEEYMTLDEAKDTEIMLFSGGLDSLAGAIEYLNNDKSKHICLVSHNANNSTTSTQNKLVGYLQKKYGKERIKHYKFECHFMGHTKSRDETQRVRMFLFSAIAFSISCCYKKDNFYVFENGITSINLLKQADVFHARASRTTHPKTIGLLKQFYLTMNDKFDVYTPYFSKNKSDIISIFRQFNEIDIISSSVSCSATRNKPAVFNHCGCCSQCIERRFALYSENLDDVSDNYAADFIKNIPDAETKQRLYKFLHFASMKEIQDKGKFVEKYFSEIDDLIDYMPGTNPDDKVMDLYNFVCKNNSKIIFAAQQMQSKYENLLDDVPQNSLLEIIAQREYLRSPIYARVSEIDIILVKAIPQMFQREKPKSENDLNDKIQALLTSYGKFDREYPQILCGITKYTPDHSQDFLIIEAKYIREHTTPSVASQGIFADIAQIPINYGVYFVVYDPYHAISDDEVFIKEFEARRKECYVRIYR